MCLALVAAVVSSAGCSALVASRGEDLNALATREQVRRAFGIPVTGGDDRPSDEFRTHRKISERWRGEYLLIPCVVTCGFSEIIFLPQELFVAARQRIAGHDLRFDYDADGNVVAVFLDGQSPFWLRRPDAPPAVAATDGPDGHR
jgi:hypothetical protein